MFSAVKVCGDRWKLDWPLRSYQMGWGLVDWVFVGDAGEGVKEWRNGVRLAFYRGKRGR